MATGEEWQGAVGRSWAANAALTDRAFSGLTQRLLERLARIPASSILDIGCGAGELSLALGRARPAASVTGVDISPDLVDAARRRGSNLPNCAFVLSDAARWRAEQSPELIVSRHGVMFFDDPVGAFEHIRGQSADGAEMVFTCFRDPTLNRWATGPLEVLGLDSPVDPDAPGPFAFASEERVRSILLKSGWRDIVIDPVDFAFITGMGEDPVADALEFFSRIGPSARILRELDAGAREVAVEKLSRWVRQHRDATLVAFPAAAWMVSARKP
jgi:SAM-dependent methyltransferase